VVTSNLLHTRSKRSVLDGFLPKSRPADIPRSLLLEAGPIPAHPARATCDRGSDAKLLPPRFLLSGDSFPILPNLRQARPVQDKMGCGTSNAAASLKVPSSATFLCAPFGWHPASAEQRTLRPSLLGCPGQPLTASNRPGPMDVHPHQHVSPGLAGPRGCKRSPSSRNPGAPSSIPGCGSLRMLSG
jgi:hypothetical protein